MKLQLIILSFIVLSSFQLADVEGQKKVSGVSLFLSFFYLIILDLTIITSDTSDQICLSSIDSIR